jgi:hypothetical protein
VKKHFLLLALIVGLHTEPAWALLLIVIAIAIKLFPLALALELASPAIISFIKKNRRYQNEL